jgi:rhamnose transport system permease protein
MTTQNPPTSRWNFLSWLLRFREAGLALFIVILVVGVTLRNPNFLTVGNWTDILLNGSILIIVALTEMCIILTKGIDISVSSMLALVAMMVGFILLQYPDTPLILVVLLGMALGAILGAFNGLIIAYGGVPPIITTLGTFTVYRGLVFFYSNGTWVNSFELPAAFKMLSKGTPLGLPNMVIFAILAILVVYYFLNHTRTGRDIYAVGSNLEAAFVSGIRTRWITFLVYLLSGVACGFGGVLWASRYESAQTNTALGFELTVIASAVIGGVSLSGGVGTVLGVVLGALLLSIISIALAVIHISPFWETAAQGLLILVAVVIDAAVSRRSSRI